MKIARQCIRAGPSVDPYRTEISAQTRLEKVARGLRQWLPATVKGFDRPGDFRGDLLGVP